MRAAGCIFLSKKAHRAFFDSLKNVLRLQHVFGIFLRIAIDKRAAAW